MAVTQFKERQKEIAMKVGLGIGLFAILFWAMILPALKESTKLRVEIQESQQRLKLHQELTLLKKTLSVLEAPLDSISDRSTLLGKISDLATRNHINVQALTPKTEPSGDYIKLRLEMQGSASFFSLIKFLQATEALKSPLNVQDVTLLRQRDGEMGQRKGLLQTQLVLETFLLKQKRAGTQS